MSARISHSAKILLVIGFVFLAGCADPVGDAKDRYEIVKRTGDKAEICRKGRELAEVYLQMKNEEEYQRQKLFSDIECQSAELDRRGY